MANSRNLTPWRPGQSGNPGGRPKKKPITELYQEMLNDGAIVEAIRKAILKNIRTGKSAFVSQLREMTERVEGKVTQPIAANVTAEVHHLERLTDEELGLLQQLISKITDPGEDSAGDGAPGKP
jgi:hypothetical protein